VFLEIDRDNTGKITLHEFVEAYFDQQREVEERIDELKLMIEEDTKKRNELRNRLVEIQDNEQMNSYGVMIGSVLTVNPYEARDL